MDERQSQFDYWRQRLPMSINDRDIYKIAGVFGCSEDIEVYEGREDKIPKQWKHDAYELFDRINRQLSVAKSAFRFESWQYKTTDRSEWSFDDIRMGWRFIRTVSTFP